MSDGWPVELRGVTESVVTTLGPNDRWNVAALGLHAPESGDSEPDSPGPDGRVTARTWGRTRTRRNFAERGRGHVQFVRDPVLFVDAALSTVERDDPVLEEADAVVAVDVARLDEGEEAGTEWVDWELTAVDATVVDRTVPTTNRGYNAVVEATVAASRLNVPGYDAEQLREHLRYFESVVDTCGGDRERLAFDRLSDLVDADW